MARFNGATVLLIIVATVSVYTCAIIAGATLGRTLDRPNTIKPTPSDRALRVSVSFRGLAEDFAKELWAGYHREGAGEGRSRANREAAAEPMLPVANESELRNATQQVTRRTRDDVRTRAAEDPWSRNINMYKEITDERLPGGREVIKVGPWGGPGGNAFYMRRGRGRNAPRVSSVLLRATDAIHSFLQISSEETVLLRRTQTQQPTYQQINFTSDEQLIAVEGTYGHCSYVSQVVVTSLTFRTDKRTTYGPYGKETGTPFSIQAAANGCIVGFWGRSGTLLDAIGVYIRPCQAHKAAS